MWRVNKVLQDEEIDKTADKLVNIQEQENTLLASLHTQLAELEKDIHHPGLYAVGSRIALVALRPWCETKTTVPCSLYCRYLV